MGRDKAVVEFLCLVREYLALTGPHQEEALLELRESIRRHCRAIGYSPNRINQGFVIVDKLIFKVVGSLSE